MSHVGPFCALFFWHFHLDCNHRPGMTDIPSGATNNGRWANAGPPPALWSWYGMSSLWQAGRACVIVTDRVSASLSFSHLALCSVCPQNAPSFHDIFLQSWRHANPSSPSITSLSYSLSSLSSLLSPSVQVLRDISLALYRSMLVTTVMVSVFLSLSVLCYLSSWLLPAPSLDLNGVPGAVWLLHILLNIMLCKSSPTPWDQT